MEMRDVINAKNNINIVPISLFLAVRPHAAFFVWSHYMMLTSL